MAYPQSSATIGEDLDTLLALRDALAGTASINWSPRLPVDEWQGVTIAGSRVKGLFLRKSKLSGIIPAAIGSLSELEELVLDDNELTGRIPETLGRLTYLRSLWLKNNRLSGTIPSELGNLARLEEFTLLNNQLSGSIPVSLGKLCSLRELWLGRNLLCGKIPAELGKLSSLQVLWLKHNQLTGTVPKEILQLPEIERIVIDNNLGIGLDSNSRRRTAKRKGKNLSQDEATETGSPKRSPRKKRRRRVSTQEEYSPKWEAGDKYATEFYVYILKLEGGEFYAGQTRELRERMMEHRDGDTRSTAGKNPKLVWFGIVSSREEATRIESKLKQVCDRNPREIRRMVRHFQDLVEQLEFD